MNSLNELLYRQLVATFGDVQITNSGEPIQLHYRRDWYFREGRLKAGVISSGETYKVSCPFCSDTRHRLWINHHWGVRDEKTGDDMLHLVHCFNDDCVNTRVVQKELHAMVYPRGEYGRSMKVQITKPMKTPAPIVSAMLQLPPRSRLSVLPEGHPALCYLTERGFNPAELESRWGVSYCTGNHMMKPYFPSGRIMMPVYTITKSLFAAKDDAPKRILAGWQARTIDPNPPKHVPKYLTAAGMKKSQLLYGLPEAFKADVPIVVCEGVTDAWRVGPGAVALFGKTISTAQVKLILRYFRGRPVVVLLDRDAADEADSVCEQIRRARMRVDSAPVVGGKLPAGRKDPGECTQPELRKVVAKAVAGAMKGPNS